MDKYNNYVSTAVAVNSSGVALLPENKSRTALVIFNQGTAAVRVYFDTPAAYVELTHGQGVHFNKAPINAVTAKTQSGTATVTVWEA